jgi:hypothetical protein
MYILPSKKKRYKKLFFDFGIFWPKNSHKLRNLAKSKLFDEIFWNLVCRYFPAKKSLQKTIFQFRHFLAEKTVKIEKWQNLNRLVKFSEIRYVDTSQQKKRYKKLFFDFGIFWPKKTAKIDQK